MNYCNVYIGKICWLSGVLIETSVYVGDARLCVWLESIFSVNRNDATTDGDHVNKEHTRIKVISATGYKPIRVMFYYPNRTQAKRIQETLETLYKGIGGEYYWGENAWDYVKYRSEIDLKTKLETIVEENAHEDDLTSEQYQVG